MDIVNPYAFSIGDTQFPEGEIHLNGENALSYVRARYNLPDGDFGRNQHQIIVLRAMLQKILSPEIINSFTELMDALNGTFLTNISTDSIWDFANMQINDLASWDVIQYSVTGSTGGGETASMPGRQLSVVFPNENHVAFISGEIQKMMENNRIEQGTLPQ